MTPTIEGNKLIAEFMGGKIEQLTERHGEPMGVVYGERVEFLECYKLTDLEYHSNWKWLMGVVEKINTMAIDNYGEMSVIIYPYKCLIGHEGDNEYVASYLMQKYDTLIQIVYNAVIQFITWYQNQQNPKQ